MRVTLLLPVLLLLLAGCRSGAGASGPGAGRVGVEWGGALQGKFSGPATARWCARDSLLEVFADRNDTAVGIALASQDTLQVGDYPVYQVRLGIRGRPQGSAALRLLSGGDLKSFESTGGRVTVTEGGSRRASARFDVQLRPPAGGDSLRLTGSFAGLDLTPALGLCGRANR